MGKKWDDAQRWKEAQRKADRLRAQAHNEAPLFAEQLPTITAQEMFWHWRRTKARCAAGASEFDGERGLTAFQVFTIRLYARNLLGQETSAKLDAYCQRTYPSTDYFYGFWSEALTGKRIELKLERNPDPDARPLVICTEAHQAHHMTKAEFYALFPYTDPPAPEDHPAGQELDQQLQAFIDRLTPRP